MGSFSFRIPLSDPAEAFAELPRSAKSFLKEGFAVLRRVYPANPELLLRLALESITAGFEPDQPEFSKKLGLTQPDARALMGAVNFLALMASEPTRAAAPSTVRSLVAADIMRADDAEVAAELLGALLRDTPEIQGTFRRAAMSGELLPALAEFETVVDVRLSFKEDAVELAVPVLLVHIDTDASNRELWFQMSKKQVQKAIEDLTKALSQMQAAESWAARRP